MVRAHLGLGEGLEVGQQQVLRLQVGAVQVQLPRPPPITHTPHTAHAQLFRDIPTRGRTGGWSERAGGWGRGAKAMREVWFGVVIRVRVKVTDTLTDYIQRPYPSEYG